MEPKLFNIVNNNNTNLIKVFSKIRQEFINKRTIIK